MGRSTRSEIDSLGSLRPRLLRHSNTNGLLLDLNIFMANRITEKSNELRLALVSEHASVPYNSIVTIEIWYLTSKLVMPHMQVNRDEGSLTPQS